MRQPPNQNVGIQRFLWPWPAFVVGAAALLTGSFLYVWLRLEPVLEYHGFGPYFLRRWDYFETFLHRPGGLANYAGAFLAQLNYLNWLGALVFVTTQLGVLLAAVVCLVRIGGRAPGFVALVPAFALLVLRNRYDCPVPAVSVGLLLALSAAAAYLSLPWRRAGLLVVAGGLISALLFYLAGLWSALLFAVLCGLFASFQMRNRPAGLGSLVLALVVPALTLALGDLKMVWLIQPWPEGVDGMLAAALYASVPVAGVLLAWLPKPAVSRRDSRNQPADGHWHQASGFGQVVAALLLVVGGAAVWLSFDHRQKLLVQIDYDSSCGRYEPVIAAARQVAPLSYPAEVRAHLALYHTGRLAEDLFTFPNMIEDAKVEGLADAFRVQSQILLELGLVNDAEHSAHEALEMQGQRPDLLRVLARINLVKHRPQAAQVFLNVLSLIPFQGERANANWPETSPEISPDESAFLARIRSVGLTNDVLHSALPMQSLLELLLAANPTNQMAFEYLMANYLMDLNLPKTIEYLQLLDNFNYPRLPRSYEEALVLYQQVAKVQVDLRGRQIRPETVERFRRFQEAVKQLNGKADRQAAMASEFGDTYWYFYGVRRLKRAAQSPNATP
jgi:hypothetical protein